MATTENTTPVRYTYWHLHPRGFANECEIVRCATPAEVAEAEAEGFERLTRADALRHIAWVNLENASMGSGSPFGRIRLSEIPTWAESSDFRHY